MIARRSIQDRYCHIASIQQRANLVATYTMTLKKYQIATHLKDDPNYQYDRTNPLDSDLTGTRQQS
ncbi:hypothetical protein WDV92_16580 [Pseudomonas syringae pv. atrofaciens]